MRVLRQARSIRLVAMVVLALLAAGFSACSDILLLPGEEGDWCAEPKPGDDNPCGEGLICSGGYCVPLGGIGDALTETDGNTLDASDGESTDSAAAETSDTGPSDGGDDADGELPLADLPPSDRGTSDDAIDAVPDVPFVQVGLGEACDANCIPGLVCLEQLGGSRTCGFLADGNCAPCVEATDCPESGSACVDDGGAGTFCAAPCGPQGDCGTGFVCVDDFCRPTTGSCVCSQNLIGFPLSCSNSSPLGTCTGQAVCSQSGWGNCSAAQPQAEICDGKDNNCDGVTDEAPAYLELGVQLLVGAPCGLGVCAGGEVVCDASGGVTCSSSGLAVEELCSDAVDNDCDGFVNDGCVSDDFDGDGVVNEEDCDPFDSAVFSGAPESCCPPGGQGCDTNCDGETTPCQECDLDFDGHCPPEDCNEGDPDISPSAKEVCNDGIDQDCAGGDLLCSAEADLDNDGYIPPADCNEGNPAINPGQQELCDGLDNDCDDIVDEGNPQGGQPCGTGAEYCKSGIEVCTHYDYGVVVQCQGAQLFAEEICDGLDNDCNGTTDDPWPEIGQPCDGPDSDSCPFGTYECAPDGVSAICSSETQVNKTEVCNGIDDDCNGATDEFVCDIDDIDGDGYTADAGDCDDLLAEYRPGADEPCCDPAIPNAQVVCDLNCDGVVVPCFNDADADGSPASLDCNDADPTVFPGAPEKCDDGIDQDCQDGDLSCALVQDADSDKYPDAVDCNPNNPLVFPGAPEVCNYIDDDCDGVIDDGNPAGLTGPCGPDTDTCTPGQWVCVHDSQTATVQVLCIGDKFQVPELCNGIDDDCDGETDESFDALGQPCDGPDSDSCANGLVVCREDGDGTVCGPESIEDIVEVCDAADNDCDGELDNGLFYDGTIAIGAICDGVGTCGTGVAICAPDGSVTCSTNPDGPFSQASAELCDNLDNDCDGLTDEDYNWQGTALGEVCDGIGSCGEGIVECSAIGEPTCSTNADGSDSQATPEVCDGVDNDCDGQTDEGLTVADSTCKQVGVCGQGGVTAVCVGSEWICQYAAVTGYEEEETACDDQDNDCDGQTDEDLGLGLPCDGADSDECKNGLFTCRADGSGVECVNETLTNVIEQCDGVDNDCDGVTDNVPTDPVAAGCSTQGVCGNTSTIDVICDPAGGPGVCSYTQVPDWQPVETLCDFQDNDCDGLVDEGLTYFGIGLGEACQGRGVCGDGVVQCSSLSGETICSTEAGGLQDQSSPEICDGLDNDCDGETDEDFVWNDLAVDAPCTPPGVCGLGIVECALGGQAAVCSTAAGGSEDATQPEVCDGVDSDCDGQTDEIEDLNPLADSGCQFLGVCNDPSSFVACEEGTWVCNYSNIAGYQPFENLCDELDNDCDGETDEGWLKKGLPCDGDDEDACATGTWTCGEGGGLECTNETGIGTPEICDGEDNDCDGLKDEGVTYNGLPLNALCDGIGQCGLGTVQCNASGAATCSSNPDGTDSAAVEEICDGLDNDCDGVDDNGVNWEGIPLGVVCDGIGECGIGVVECSLSTPGLATCSTNADGSMSEDVAEICDDKDNNCDGQTDEGDPGGGAACDGPDADQCATGFTVCNPGGALTCVDDVECALNAVCYDPGGGSRQSCTCQGQVCNVEAGDQCQELGCVCSGSSPLAACNVPAGQICAGDGSGCFTP